MTSIQPSDLPSAVVILCYFGGEAQLNFILSVSTFPTCLPIDHTSPNRGNDISLLTFHYTGIGTILQINLNFMYTYCKKFLIGKPFFLNWLLFYVWHVLYFIFGILLSLGFCCGSHQRFPFCTIFKHKTL